jgi:hypothetical protein
MLLDEDNPLSRFLLRAYNTHCPFCMPGGFRSVDAVHSERASWVVDEPLIMSGILPLLTGGCSTSATEQSRRNQAERARRRHR